MTVPETWWYTAPHEVLKMKFLVILGLMISSFSSASASGIEQNAKALQNLLDQISYRFPIHKNSSKDQMVLDYLTSRYGHVFGYTIMNDPSIIPGASISRAGTVSMVAAENGIRNYMKQYNFTNSAIREATGLLSDLNGDGAYFGFDSSSRCP